jgi:hypothetical protein
MAWQEFLPVGTVVIVAIVVIALVYRGHLG